MEPETILVADDNEEILEIIQVLLESEGYRVLLASDGREALEMLTQETDLVILDVMMPEMSGLKACVEMRKSTNAPILFLTAKSKDSDKALGFSSGGDDYLAKPFSASELLCRVKALLRRYRVYRGKPSPCETGVAEPRSGILSYHEWTLDPLTGTLSRGTSEVPLTALEFRILFLLASNRGKIFTPQNLYESVWEEPYFYTANNTLMVHIRNIRKKIEEDPGNPVYLVTVWGKGYRCV